MVSPGGRGGDRTAFTAAARKRRADLPDSSPEYATWMRLSAACPGLPRSKPRCSARSRAPWSGVTMVGCRRSPRRDGGAQLEALGERDALEAGDLGCVRGEGLAAGLAVVVRKVADRLDRCTKSSAFGRVDVVDADLMPVDLVLAFEQMFECDLVDEGRIEFERVLLEPCVAISLTNGISTAWRASASGPRRRSAIAAASVESSIRRGGRARR